MPQLRYVVLHHIEIDEPHYDLMFESAPDSELSTWRVPHWPPRSDDKFTPLPNHRRAYLEYEGPISNNRGRVKRIASGICRIIEDSAQTLTVDLDGTVRINLTKLG